MSNGKVVSLVPNNALAVDKVQLAERIRGFADRLEAGEYGEVERVCCVFDPLGEEVSSRTYGRPTTNMELVGLLEYAKANAISPPAEEA